MQTRPIDHQQNTPISANQNLLARVQSVRKEQESMLLDSLKIQPTNETPNTNNEVSELEPELQSMLLSGFANCEKLVEQRILEATLRLQSVRSVRDTQQLGSHMQDKENQPNASMNIVNQRISADSNLELTPAQFCEILGFMAEDKFQTANQSKLNQPLQNLINQLPQRQDDTPEIGNEIYSQYVQDTTTQALNKCQQELIMVQSSCLSNMHQDNTLQQLRTNNEVNAHQSQFIQKQLNLQQIAEKLGKKSVHCTTQYSFNSDNFSAILQEINSVTDVVTQDGDKKELQAVKEHIEQKLQFKNESKHGGQNKQIQVVENFGVSLPCVNFVSTQDNNASLEANINSDSKYNVTEQQKDLSFNVEDNQNLYRQLEQENKTNDGSPLKEINPGNQHYQNISTGHQAYQISQFCAREQQFEYISKVQFQQKNEDIQVIEVPQNIDSELRAQEPMPVPDNNILEVNLGQTIEVKNNQNNNNNEYLAEPHSEAQLQHQYYEQLSENSSLAQNENQNAFASTKEPISAIIIEQPYQQNGYVEQKDNYVQELTKDAALQFIQPQKDFEPAIVLQQPQVQLFQPQATIFYQNTEIQQDPQPQLQEQNHNQPQIEIKELAFQENPTLNLLNQNAVQKQTQFLSSKEIQVCQIDRTNQTLNHQRQQKCIIVDKSNSSDNQSVKDKQVNVSINNYGDKPLQEKIEPRIQLKSQQTVCQDFARMPPCISININQNNEISLNIFRNPHAQNRVDKFCEQQANNYPQQHRQKTRVQAGLSAQQHQLLHQEKGIQTLASVYPQHEKIQPKTNQNNPKKLGAMTQKSQEEELYQIGLMADTYLMYNFLEQKVHNKFETMLKPHVALKMTPQPISSVGKQIFKNGLVLVAIVKLISRSSKSPFLQNYVFQFIESAFTIQSNNYIFCKQSKAAKQNFQDYLEQRYQQNYNEIRNKQQKCVKRVNVQSTALKVMQNETQPKKLQLQSNNFAFSQQSITKNLKTERKILSNQYNEIYTPNQKNQFQIAEINRVEKQIQQQLIAQTNLIANIQGQNTSQLAEERKVGLNCQANTVQQIEDRLNQLFTKANALQTNLESSNEEKAQKGQAGSKVRIADLKLTSQQKAECIKKVQTCFQNKNGKFTQLYEKYKKIRQNKKNQNLKTNEVSVTPVPVPIPMPISVPMPVPKSVLIDSRQKDPGAGAGAAQKKKKHVQFLEEAIEMRKQEPELSQQEEGTSKLRKRKKTKKIDNSFEQQDESMKAKKNNSKK